MDIATSPSSPNRSETLPLDISIGEESLPEAAESSSLLFPENATGNYVQVVQRPPVRIRFEPGQDPQYLLHPGMSVKPAVWLQQSHRQ